MKLKVFSCLLIFTLPAQAEPKYRQASIPEKFALETAPKTSLQVKGIGKVAVFGDVTNAQNVMLFLSGDGGFNAGVVEMARRLSQENFLVLGLNTRPFLKQMDSGKSACSYPAGRLEGISKAIQKTLGRKKYQAPVLTGYSSGATLVYALLAQAPLNTFAGGLSLGFCANLDVTKPLCSGRALSSNTVLGKKRKHQVLKATAQLQKPWILLNGAKDQVCSAAVARAFAQATHAQIVDLPLVGHGFGVARNWETQLREAALSLAPSSASKTPDAASNKVTNNTTSLEDFSLVEVSPANSATAPNAPFVVFLSGDGGWTTIDKEVSAGLSARGIPVVGVNMLNYLWEAKTPETMAKDMSTIAGVFSEKWKRKQFAVAGYSAGADSALAAFADPAWNKSTKNQNPVGLYLLGASLQASLEFKLSDWLPGSFTEGGDVPLLPAVDVVAKRGMRIFCIDAKDANTGLCASLPANAVKKARVGNGHHFSDEYEAISKLIAEDLLEKR